jgi:hypothetical protein
MYETKQFEKRKHPKFNKYYFLLINHKGEEGISLRLSKDLTTKAKKVIH